MGIERELSVARSISGMGFQPVALKMTGWKPGIESGLLKIWY